MIYKKIWQAGKGGAHVGWIFNVTLNFTKNMCKYFNNEKAIRRYQELVQIYCESKKWSSGVLSLPNKLFATEIFVGFILVKLAV